MINERLNEKKFPNLFRLYIGFNNEKAIGETTDPIDLKKEVKEEIVYIGSFNELSPNKKEECRHISYVKSRINGIGDMYKISDRKGWLMKTAYEKGGNVVDLKQAGQPEEQPVVARVWHRE